MNKTKKHPAAPRRGKLAVWSIASIIAVVTGVFP